MAEPTRFAVSAAGQQYTALDPARQSVVVYNATDGHVEISVDGLPTDTSVMHRIPPGDMWLMSRPMAHHALYGRGTGNGSVYVTEFH